MTNDQDFEKQLEVAKMAAMEAGGFLMKNFGKKQKITKERGKDFTTEVDLEAEKIIIGDLQREFPKDSILSEERGSIDGTNKKLWIIDPLDGTVNYAHGFPYFCVIISLYDLEKNETILGIVYNPLLKKTVYATKNQGAFLDAKKITVSKITKLSKSYITLGHFDPNKEGQVQGLDIKDRLTVQKKAFKNFLRVRELGSIGLDMINVAMGVTEAHFSFGKPWDLLGPSLIIEEAGGSVVDFYKNKIDLKSIGVLASNGQIQDEFEGIFRK